MPLPAQEVRLQAVEGKLADVQRRVENLNLAAMSQDNTRLEGEMRGLRGEVERLAYLVETADTRNKELYGDLDKRLAALEAQSRSTKLSLETSLKSPPPQPETASAEEESQYLQVFDQVKASKYDDAITGFKSLIEQWPRGRYADNAWYWLGESYYVKKDYSNALTSFETVVSQFAASPKAADAQFKIGLTQQQMDRKDAARDSFNKVIKTHPASSAAALARARLDQLK